MKWVRRDHLKARRLQIHAVTFLIMLGFARVLSSWLEELRKAVGPASDSEDEMAPLDILTSAVSPASSMTHFNDSIPNKSIILVTAPIKNGSIDATATEGSSSSSFADKGVFSTMSKVPYDLGMPRVDQYTTIDPSKVSDLPEAPKNTTHPPATDLVTTNPRPILWIHVVSFGEGMASWKMSFTFLLGAAKHLGATLVEPCIQNGRLHSCALEQNITAAIRLRHVFDLDKIKQVYPYVVSYEEFVKETNYFYNSSTGHGHLPNTDNTIVTCLSERDPLCGSIKNSYGVKRSKFMYDARDKAIQATTLLEIVQFDRWSLQKWKKKEDNGSTTLVMDSLGLKPEQLLHFPSSLYGKVESMLHDALNISKRTPFAAIQWRPEQMKAGYTECAQAILDARGIISQQDDIPMENFVLISPLSLVHSLQWGGVANEADANINTSYPSLQHLYNNGFKKLDQSFGSTGSETIPDEVFLYIYDMILAQKAKSFTTCSGCSPREFCSKCNWQKEASKFAVYLRSEYTGGQGKTNTCWPRKRSSIKRLLRDTVSKDQTVVAEDALSLLW